MIGVFVGVSLFSESDKMVSDLKSRIQKSDLAYSNMNSEYFKKFDDLEAQYDIFKKYTYNGSELRCVELNDYYIDSSDGNLVIEFLETFYNKP